MLACLALFFTYRFPCNELINRLGTPVPVLVVHGDGDHVVSLTQGRALFDAIAAPKRFVIVRGGDHNDLAPSDPATYWAAVGGFIESLQRVGSED